MRGEDGELPLTFKCSLLAELFMGTEKTDVMGRDDGKVIKQRRQTKLMGEGSVSRKEACTKTFPLWVC